MRKKYIFVMFMSLLMIFNLFYIPVNAKTTIRVGCVDLEDFLTFEDGTVSGYGAEFLNEIAKYTNWNYEYVQGHWDECLEWLKDGKIDLLLPAQYTKERAEVYLYSDKECSIDYAALIALEERDDFYFNDPQSYNHLKIGMIRENYLNTIFEKYVSSNHLDIERIYFDNLTQMNEALHLKQVDLIVNGSMNSYKQRKYIAKLGTLPAYFITSKKHPEIMKQLNSALDQIDIDNPYYVANLHEKYYGDNTRKAIGFTKKETEYIKQHSEIVVICDEDDYPQEYLDSQTYKGIFVDLLDMISQQSGLKFKKLGTKNNQIEEMLEDKTADIVLSTVYSPKMSQQLQLSDSYFSTSYSFIAHKQNDVNINTHLKIAITGTQLDIINLIHHQYPQWEIQKYSTVNECLNALSHQEVDGTLVSSFYLHMNKMQDYPDLIEVLPKVLDAPVCIGFPLKSDPILISIMNKSIHKISQNDLDSVVITTMGNDKAGFSFNDFIQEYPLEILIGCIVAVGIICFAFLQARFNHVVVKKNKELEEKNQALRNAKEVEKGLEEKMRIDDLSGLLNKANVDIFTRYYLAHDKKAVGALMIIDIDYFKNINDSYGHVAGDIVIQQFGDLLKTCCRTSDIVGRVGGDEFYVFLKDMDKRELIFARAKLILDGCQAIREGVTCSIGIALLPIDANDYDTLYQCADQALYTAKELGRSRCCFYGEDKEKD